MNIFTRTILKLGIILVLAGCSPIDRAAVDTAVKSTQDKILSTFTPFPTNQPLPTSTAYPTQTPLPSQPPYNTQMASYVVVTPTPLPDIGSVLDCGDFNFRVIQTEKYPNLKGWNPPSGIYLNVFVEYTNTTPDFKMEIDPNIFTVESLVAGKKITYTIYLEYAIRSYWAYNFWTSTWFPGGFQSPYEPFYPDTPSRLVLLFDVHPDAESLRMVISGCPSDIALGKNVTGLTKLTGGKRLPAPDPVDRSLLAGYEEAYWKDIVEKPALLEGKNVILRGRVQEVLNSTSFELEIAGTWEEYNVTMNKPLYRIYSEEAVVVYGTMKNGVLIGDYIEVTNIPR